MLYLLRRACCVVVLAAGMVALRHGDVAISAADDDIFPFPVHENTLDNGLKIVVIPFDSPGIMAFQTVIRTGARDEVEPGHSGFAHFFEHMMFRGTPRYSGDAYNAVLKRMGADNNAGTWDDKTVYYIVGPATALDKIAEIEADHFKNLKYSQEAFQTEALAVLGEYNKSASNPFLPMEEKLRDLAFTRHTYKHTTIGFLADIKAMPTYYEYSLKFFERFYRADNATVVVVGDVKPDTVFATIAKHFGDWKSGYQAPNVEPEPPQTERKTAHIDWPNPTRPYLLAGYHTPAFSTRNVDFPTLDIINELLFSESADLYQELVVTKQLVDFIQGGAEDHRDPYLFTVVARVKSDDLVPQVKQRVDEALAGLKKTPVDASRLDRIKSHLRYQFAMHLDTPDAVADRVSHYLGLTGSVGSINELFRRYQEVTPADVQRVAAEIFRPQNETYVTLGQAKTTTRENAK
jgi:zinc protease